MAKCGEGQRFERTGGFVILASEVDGRQSPQTVAARRAVCRLLLRERTSFRGAKGDTPTLSSVLIRPVAYLRTPKLKDEIFMSIRIPRSILMVWTVMALASWAVLAWPVRGLAADGTLTSGKIEAQLDGRPSPSLPNEGCRAYVSAQ